MESQHSQVLGTFLTQPHESRSPSLQPAEIVNLKVTTVYCRLDGYNALEHPKWYVPSLSSLVEGA